MLNDIQKNLKLIEILTYVPVLLCNIKNFKYLSHKIFLLKYNFEFFTQILTSVLTRPLFHLAKALHSIFLSWTYIN